MPLLALQDDEDDDEEDNDDDDEEEDEPQTLRGAINSNARDNWLAAVHSELSSHHKNGTWTPSEVPRGRAAIPSRWVFKLTRGPAGEIIKYKARLVAKGFKQRPFLDFNEKFLPTLRTTTFRLVCALACQYQLELHQTDVSTAFLVPKLKEEIYMRLPEQPLADLHLPCPSPLVRLHKTLYGLVQSQREFYLHFTKVLTKMRFQQSGLDPCLWLKISMATSSLPSPSTWMTVPSLQCRVRSLASRRHSSERFL